MFFPILNVVKCWRLLIVVTVISIRPLLLLALDERCQPAECGADRVRRPCVASDRGTVVAGVVMATPHDGSPLSTLLQRPWQMPFLLLDHKFLVH